MTLTDQNPKDRPDKYTLKDCEGRHLMEREISEARILRKKNDYLSQYNLLFRYAAIWLLLRNQCFGRSPHVALEWLCETIIHLNIHRVKMARNRLKYHNNPVDEESIELLKCALLRWSEELKKYNINI